MHSFENTALHKIFLIDNKALLICGGENELGETYADCILQGTLQNEDLLSASQKSSSIVFKNSYLWITGGSPFSMYGLSIAYLITTYLKTSVGAYWSSFNQVIYPGYIHFYLARIAYVTRLYDDQYAPTFVI